MRMRVLFAVIALAAAVSCVEVRKVDVLIAGGGASGVTAAVQAARMGAEVVVMEEGPWLGGMLTSAGVSCIDGNYRMRSGLFGEFLDSLAARYGGYDALKTGWVSNVCFEPHVGQEIFTSMTDACKDNLVVERNSTIRKVERKEGDWLVTFVDGDGNAIEGGDKGS